MAKKSFNEIVEILKEKFSISEVAWGDFGDYNNKNYVEGIGPSVVVEKYGGEDRGSEWYSVRHYTDHDVFIKIEGYYSSYNGTDFDGYDYEEVFPTEVIKKEFLTTKEISKANIYNSNK